VDLGAEGKYMSSDTQKDIVIFQNRLRELADKSFTRRMFTFTDYMGVAEQDVFHRMEKELQYAEWKLWGGRACADRVLVRFGSPDDLGYEEEFPIICIHMKPKNGKFADDLTHRDFLGALMNLGIERGTLGDILVKDKDGYLFCLEKVADLICSGLNKVKHTSITCEIVSPDIQIPEEAPAAFEYLVASERLDGVIAKVYGMSRAYVLQLFESGKIYLGGRLSENHTKQLRQGEVVSVRGFGKFIYDGQVGESRKGKLYVQVRKYL
jgi:RNA-binding protein YlmH